jgi:dihydropyrimidinase
LLDLVIRNAKIAGASETYDAEIGIKAGTIVLIGQNLPSAQRDIDAQSLIVAPGAIDVHTHFQHFVGWVAAENADDYESGTRAAAAGGITTILNFAFQERGRGLRPAVDEELQKADGQAHIDYGLHLVPTDLSVGGILDEILRLADEGFASLKVFTTIDDYLLSDAEILRLMAHARERGLLINVHAEDHPLISQLTAEHLSRGETEVRYLPHSRPPLAEALATARIGRYASAMNAAVYFVHLSTAAALTEVRNARAEGAEIYVETRPVYLYLDQGRYELPDRQGNKWACLPPLRSAENQAVLWQGLRTGEIQTYATDHAPWQSHQKVDPARSFPQIPAGVSNVQTSIGMLYSEGVAKSRMSLEQFVAVTSTNPAKLFGMWPRKGTITIGADADFVLIDPVKEFRVDSATMESKADYDPCDGFQAVGWPVMTISRGEVIYEDGVVLSRPGRGHLLERGPYHPL